VKTLAALSLIPFLLAPFVLTGAELRVGIVGGDGAEAIALTRILNDVSQPDHVPGAHVVAVYRGGRIDKAGEELHARWKVDITPDIGSLCRKVDGVLIAAGAYSGRLEQIKAAIAAGKPVFLESPLAATAEEARTVAQLAQSAGATWFSASAVRFGEITEIKASYMLGATTWEPGPIGPRSVDMLFALMGRGCEEVRQTAELVEGHWPGGRTGSVRPGKPEEGFGVLAIRPKGQSRVKIAPDYPSLLLEVVKFFETGQAPVSSEETLEMLAFLDAAQRSKAAAGAPVKLR
jgi:hypothetical protein